MGIKGRMSGQALPECWRLEASEAARTASRCDKCLCKQAAKVSQPASVQSTRHSSAQSVSQ